jgi:hypothetical protein
MLRILQTTSQNVQRNIAHMFSSISHAFALKIFLFVLFAKNGKIKAI